MLDRTLATLRLVRTTEPRAIRVVEAPSRAEPDVEVAGHADAVTAAGTVNYPLKPPADWFADPELDGPTTLRIEESGRVYGHVASLGIRHIGLPGNVTAPRSKMGYRRFRTGNMICADGSTVRVGRLTMDTGHAPMDMTAGAASRHYDETGSIIAFCAAGDDEYGIWVAGCLRPDIDPADVIVARGSPLSGDWRQVDGHLELVGALAVVVNGFEIPEPLAQVASGQPLSLVAAGMVVPSDAPPSDAPASKPKTRDLSRVRTPEELVAMTDTTNPEPTEDDDESLAAAGNPFAKGEPAPDDGDDAPSGSFDNGDTVAFEGYPFQVVGSNDDGTVVIEASVPADQLEAADEAMAAAAYARFDERQQDRVRDAKLKQAAAQQARTSQQLESVTAALTSVTAKLEAIEADKRADQARELLASAGIE